MESTDLNLTQVSPAELETALDFFIANKMPALIVGPPGCGKTAIMRQRIAHAGAEERFFDAVISDVTDYKGFPAKDGDRAKWIPFDDLRILFEATKPTVAVFDDFGQATPQQQAPAMQLWGSGRIGDFKISEYVTFLMASNRKEDFAGVSGILEPVKSRNYTILELLSNANDWSRWAIKDGQPMDLIQFVRFSETRDNNWLTNFKPSRDMVNSPCARTIAHVGEMINKGIPESIKWAAIAGAAGNEFAIQYRGFLEIYNKVPSPDLIILNPDAVDVPDETRPDLLYAVCGALAYKSNENNFENIVKYVERLPAEFQILFMKDVKLINEDLQKTGVYINWASKNHNIYI